jgi:hypothetical protein
MNTSANLMLDDEEPLVLNKNIKLVQDEEDAVAPKGSFRLGLVLIGIAAAVFYGAPFVVFH